jgi:hypothetical protein
MYNDPTNSPNLSRDLAELYERMAAQERTAAVSAAGGGVTDHGALAGLGDDDHPQYLLEDGTRGSFTFDQTAGRVGIGGSPRWVSYLFEQESQIDLEVDGVSEALALFTQFTGEAFLTETN